MEDSRVRFVPLATKTVVCHTITYFVCGLLAYKFLHYEAIISAPDSGLRQTTTLWVTLGAPLQVFRGILFASIFYLLRDRLFDKKDGWLVMAWMLIGIGILGTFAAPGGSLEGFIYTTTPALLQMRGWLEVVPQAVLLSALLCFWVRHPGKKWMNWGMSGAYVIAAGLPLLSLVAPKR
ncbi:hypothetical protein [Occallatibacter savannae]|uniref:hypothetical protein n=1 Tax=Occallatibacter savannae TaxID=1002691 RepID=UPI000D68CF60|nr:hypothetical protein [Occallatibacter savannae]